MPRRKVEIEVGDPQVWKKYQKYELEVDPNQGDKAREIRLCSFARPHMRAFHCSWWSFFIAFFIWFAIVPLLPEIKHDLQITKRQIWNSTIANFGAVIFIRLLLGPLCDKFGSRLLFMVILCFASIPTACTGLIQSANDLTILRIFIGFAGGSFIMCQYWSTNMFTREVVGTANALTAGWGNLGAGVTQLIVGSFLFPLFKVFFDDKDNPSEYAWRCVCIVPACVAFLSGIVVYCVSDDYPHGTVKELKEHGSLPSPSPVKSCSSASMKLNSWLLFFQYACCFGVELTMNSASALYFKEKFGMSTETASAVAAIFGWVNLFARGIGGFISDNANVRFGMRGRLYTQSILLAMEGFMVLIFANSDSLFGSIVTLVFFSLFVQAAEGSTYGIVPYVDEQFSGAVTGIVGAGGNAGAVILSILFREFDYGAALLWMGLAVLFSSFLTVFIRIPGHGGIFFNHDGGLIRDENDDDDDDDEDSCIDTMKQPML